ncbi:hypothetical protein O7626_34245 [Micromonospora sp. WMMD1102]|uniref:hypothetical protein n=1 Tax=Micromonospora sp. WMMD1102 TaxID=3016105 RepID=UPI0024151214|nr:hypothetical protein [Micromonospora sp. WMMD1102]MDG4790915.1 hypothetical protein [Micromonospora sp. WMMD1102]
MSERANRLLREAVHELAGSPHQPPDFASAAIAQGRRIRRRRQTMAAAAAVVAIGAIVAPYVWLRPDPRPPLAVGGPPAATAPVATATGSPTPRPTPGQDWSHNPVELPGGALLLTAGSTGAAGPTWVYDPANRRYVSLPATYTAVRASPHRTVAAVRRTDRPTDVGLYDLATGKPRWFRAGGTVLAFDWSPDGGRLLITLQDRKTGMYSIGLLTPDNGSFQRYPVKTRDLGGCVQACQFTWLPSGKEVALPLAGPVFDLSGENPPAAKSGLQLFAVDDGVPTRFLPVRGDILSSAAWSPDGSMVVVSVLSPGSGGAVSGAESGAIPRASDAAGRRGEAQTAAQLVSTDTGKVLRQLPSADVAWVGPARLLYLDGTGQPGRLVALLVDPAGAEHERVELPAELMRSDEFTVAVR